MRKLLFAFFAACLMMACAGNDHAPVPTADEVWEDSVAEAEDTLVLFDEEPEPVAADMLFDDFFYTFTTDRRYQMQRIRFPLRGKHGDEELSLSREDWEAMDRYASQDFFSVIYERDDDIALQNDTSVSEVGVEWIDLSDDLVERYNFRRIGGKWQLTDFEKEETSRTPHAGFAHFYAQFAADSLFRRESVVFPLRLLGEDEEGNEDVTEIDEDDWDEFASEMPMPRGVMTNIDYGQAAFSENRKILMVEGLSNGLLVKYKFDRTQERWQLYEVEF